MNSLIVLAHPEPNSFNGALARQAEGILLSQRHVVQISDLYAKQFDPAEHSRHFPQRKVRSRFFPQTEQRFSADQGTLPTDVKAEIDALFWADFVLLQFPLWWFGMPAILKGWMDRVFAYGSLYTGSRRFQNGICQGKRAILSVTAGSSADACSYNGREGDTRLILWPINYTLHYLGFTVLEPIILTGIGGGAAADEALQRRLLHSQLKVHEDRIADIDHIAPIQFNAEEDWDEHRKLKAGAPVYSPFIRHAR